VLWFGTWVVLVLLAVLVLGRLAWAVVHKGVALMAEAGRAAERASAIAAQVERVGEQRADAEIAVFNDPEELRRRRRRRRGRRAHRGVRAGRRRSRA
jgi:hypothetical protein